MEETDLLTIKEAAELLGVSPSAVYVAIREDRLPYVQKFGKKLVVRRDVLSYKERTRPEGERPKGRPKGSKTRNRAAN